MRADVAIGPYEVVCNKALSYNFKHHRYGPCAGKSREAFASRLS